MKTALYIRVSTDEQVQHGESVSDQEQALTAWAEKHGHEVIGIYRDEGYSAHRKYTTRPALKRLLEDVRSGKVDVIAFTKLDRWSRRAMDYYALQDILDSHHTSWVAILEDYDTMSSDGRLKVGIMLSVNQHEAERTSDRIKFTFSEKRKRGEIISGNMPMGYALVDGQPVMDPNTQQAMQAFWDSYTATGRLGASLDAAAAHGLVIKSSTASYILRNAMNYTGLIQGVSCDPYITVEQAEQVLASRHCKPRKTDAVYLFSGILHCAECGGRMGSHRHRKANGGYTHYYNCTRHYGSRSARCSCALNPSESLIESLCIAQLDEALSAAYSSPDDAPAGPSAADIADEIDRLNTRRSRGWEAYLDGIVDKQEFEDERRRIDARINELRQITPALPKKEHKKTTLPIGWKEQYMELSQENRRAFWYGIISRIDYSAEGVTLTVK